MTTADSSVRRAPFTSLRTQLPLLAAALVTLVVAVYCIAAYHEMRAEAVERERGRLLRVARELAEISADGAQRRAGALRRAAQHPALVRALVDSAGAADARAAIGSSLSANDSTVESLELWTAAGGRITVYGPPSRGADSVVLQALLRSPPSGAPAMRSPLYASGGQVRVWSLVPVESGGRQLGILAERRRLANAPGVEEQIRQLTGRDVGVYFTNHGHDVWTDLRGRPVAAPFRLRDTSPSVAASLADGTPVFAARADVASTPWTIVLALPKALVLERPREFLQWMVTVGAVLLLLGVGSAWMLGRHVAHPLEALTRAGEHVARGDFRQRVPVPRTDELGRLARTFNSMAERIGVAQDELARRVADGAALARALEQRNRELDEAWGRALDAVHRTERLQAATAALAGALDWPTIASVFRCEGLALSGAGAGGFYLLSPDGQWLEPLRPDAPASGAASRDARIEVGRVSFIHDAVRRGVPAYLASAADGKDQVDQPLELAGLDGRAWVALPLKVRGGVHGILILAFAEPQDFPGGLRGSLEALAAQCSQTMERILVYEEAVNARWAAEAASRAKSQFLAMMSHELRTPLNAIGGYAELMDLGLRGPVTEAQRADLARIQRSKQHLLSIIDDLLDHARLDAGQLTLQLAPQSLQDVLLDVEALMAPQIASKGLHLDTSSCATDAVVRVDRDKLCQVLANLVTNALRFTDPGGTIRIGCESAPSHVRVRVTDTGIGIPEQQREAIFEPFTQVDTGLTRRAGGTGLGLAISRQLTEAMGGTLTVESVLGVGSTFVVSLPLVPHGALPPGLDLPDRREARGEREAHGRA